MVGLRLGLCCINTELRKDNIFCSSGLIRRTFTVEKAKAKALSNIANIEPLMKWNFEHGIRHLRLSSDMFPHYTDPETESYTLDFAKEALAKIGVAAKKYGHRLTFHPGQFVLIGSKGDIFEKTILDLSLHADILDMIGIGERGVICIHFGGIYGDKEGTTRRWIDQFALLPLKVRAKVCIENCERAYCLRDCLDLAEQCKIPVIYDNLHNDCHNQIRDIEETDQERDDILDEVVATWRGCTPVMHIASQAPDKRIGAHSDFIQEIPGHFFDLADRNGIIIDIEVEAKMKELAILKLFAKHKGTVLEEYGRVLTTM